jgi:hypothetical protein
MTPTFVLHPHARRERQLQLQIVKFGRMDVLRPDLRFHRTGGVVFSEVFVLLIFMDQVSRKMEGRFMGTGSIALNLMVARFSGARLSE